MTDYKFDIDGKKLSTEEIDAKKDFDSFYKGVQTKGKSLFQKGWFWASTGMATIIIGALLFNNSNDFSSAFAEKVKKDTVSPDNLTEKPFVNPPFDDLIVEADIFKVNANKGGIFKSRYGSILRIPALAFFNKKGKTITNKTIDIRFTEYKDVADQIISGIPMTYDSAGTKYMFSSAGMVEIRGFIGDSAVNLNPEKPIEIEMKSDYSSTEYNFYCLDEKNKKWDYLGKDSVGKPEPIKLTKEEINAQFPEVKKEDVIIPENQIDAELQKAPEYQKRNRKSIQIQAQVEELSLSTPTLPIKADKEAEKFSLDIIEEENPELAMYKDVQFQLAKGESINPNHANQNWNNVSLEKGENHEVLITFSKTNSHQKVQYKAIPVLDGEAFEKAMQAYNEHIGKSEDLKKKLKDAKKQIKFLRKEIKAKAINKQLLEAKFERLEQIATLEKAKLENIGIISEVKRYFSVNNMGVFNCDRAEKMIVKNNSIIKNIKFGRNVNEAIIIDIFPDLNGIYQHTSLINADFNEYSNSTKTIGICNKKIGILKDIINGSQIFTVKGKPKTKNDLIEWLEL